MRPSALDISIGRQLFVDDALVESTAGPKWPDPAQKWTRDFLRDLLAPVREFEWRHGARIYVGEFSASIWADGAENYLRDCIDLFAEYGWDWTYHAFRESPVWDVDKECLDDGSIVPAKTDTPRKRVLIEGLKK